jgi:hypothetical protein
MDRSQYIVVLLIALAAALSGCGDDDNDDSSRSTPATSQRPNSPQTGATDAPPADDKPAGKATSNGAADDNSTAKAKPDDNGTAKAKQDEPAAPEKRTKRTEQGTKGMDLVERNLYKQARVVCKTLTLDGLAREYEVKSGKPDDVARAYAASYATTVRAAAAAGCKRGLLESK